jgi:hypothetical protein
MCASIFGEFFYVTEKGTSSPKKERPKLRNFSLPHWCKYRRENPEPVVFYSFDEVLLTRCALETRCPERQGGRSESLRESDRSGVICIAHADHSRGAGHGLKSSELSRSVSCEVTSPHWSKTVTPRSAQVKPPSFLTTRSEGNLWRPRSQACIATSFRHDAAPSFDAFLLFLPHV